MSGTVVRLGFTHRSKINIAYSVHLLNVQSFIGVERLSNIVGPAEPLTPKANPTKRFVYRTKIA